MRAGKFKQKDIPNCTRLVSGEPDLLPFGIRCKHACSTDGFTVDFHPPAHLLQTIVGARAEFTAGPVPDVQQVVAALGDDINLLFHPKGEMS